MKSKTTDIESKTHIGFKNASKLATPLLHCNQVISNTVFSLDKNVREDNEDSAMIRELLESVKKVKK